jgi:hypothetical protein
MPKDDRGIFYYPVPDKKAVRMYVRETMNGIEFRLWNDEHPDVWDHHNWIPIEVVKQASDLYKKERDPSKNPMDLYDLEIARRLLREYGERQ